MASPLSRAFEPFEGTRSAYPIALFRIGFFSGLALHFFPALLGLDEAYRPGALRTQEWSETLYARFWRIPHGELRVLSIVTMIACVCALVGFRPRIAAAVSGAGFYAFASFNGLHLQTLALVEAWAILLLFTICGGGGAVLSVDALLRRKPAPPGVEPRLLSGLVLYQVLLGVFFSGVEKLLAGWPWTNEMGVVLSYPRGFVVRDWVASTDWLHRAAFTHAMTWVTIVVELGTPLGLLFRRTRLVSLILYELFFLGIIAMLEVPPLFYCTFAFGGLLALGDDEVDRARAILERLSSRPRRSPDASAKTARSE